MKKLIIISLSLLIIAGCEKDPKNETEKKTGGVIISFDDKTISEWVWADSILSNYNWKATFSISKANTLTTQQFDELRNLQEKGHEIAGHGMYHTRATEYVEEHGLEDYINMEIIPMIEIFNNESLIVSSYVYPYGSRNSEIDEVLYNYFDILRGVTGGITEPSEHNCYYDGSPLVFGIGIDSSYEHFSIEYLIELLDYSKGNDKILILYAHKPVDIVTGDYQTEIETLETICKYVVENNMTFYSLNDINSIDVE